MIIFFKWFLYYIDLFKLQFHLLISKWIINASWAWFLWFLLWYWLLGTLIFAWLNWLFWVSRRLRLAVIHFSYFYLSCNLFRDLYLFLIYVLFIILFNLFIFKNLILNHLRFNLFIILYFFIFFYFAWF